MEFCKMLCPAHIYCSDIVENIYIMLLRYFYIILLRHCYIFQTKKVPMQISSHVYERPRDMSIYTDLIGFRPGSGVGSRLAKHPEKLRPGSPASIQELPPARKLPSLISRPPSFAPMRDVSLREDIPRELDGSMRTIDDETVSLSTTKEFDGRAVDPGKLH